MTPKTTDIDRSALETKKLLLEVDLLETKKVTEPEKLRLEIESLRNAFARNLVICVVTAIVSVSLATSGWIFDRMKSRAANEQVERYRREETFAHALEHFGSTSAATRSSGAETLARIAVSKDFDAELREQATAVLASRLGYEEEQGVFSSIARGLERVGTAALPMVVEQNRRAAVAVVRAIGRYAGLSSCAVHTFTDPLREAQVTSLSTYLRLMQVPAEETYIGHRIPTFDVVALTRSTYSSNFALEWRRYRDMDLSDCSNDEIASARKDAEGANRRLIATSFALTSLIRRNSGKLNGAQLQGIVVTSGELAGVSFDGASLRNSFFRADLSNADFAYCDLTDSDLSHAALNRATFVAADINRVTFPNLEQLRGNIDFPDLRATEYWLATESGLAEPLCHLTYLEQTLPHAWQKALRRQLLRKRATDRMKPGQKQQ